MKTYINKATSIPPLGVRGLYIKIFRIGILFFSLISIVSCTDNELKYIAKAPAEGEFILNASSENLVLLENGAGARTAITFAWDSLVYSVNTPVIFTLQMDTLNGDFTTPVEEQVALNSFQFSYSDSILNKKCLNLLKLNGGVEHIVKVRIKATMAYGNMPVYSNVLNVKVTPYTVAKILSFLYMPGDVSGGWSNFTTKICSRNNDGLYEGFVKAAQWNNFKFTMQPSYTGTVLGSDPSLGLYKLNDNTASQWNIWFDASGYFLVKADLNAMTWSKTEIISFCVTGDFNSWSLTANPMTYDAVNNVWTANCNISNIGFGLKIIANGDWTQFYGNNDNSKNAGELNFGGGNIVPTSTGNKKITLDLSNSEKYTYKIE